MTKLNDTQCILLSSASQRDTGSLLPLPDTLTSAPDQITKAVVSLLRLGFAAERETTNASATWREENEQRFGVVITNAGRRAIGVETNSAEVTGPSPADRRADRASATEPAMTKSALVLSLLQREGGASIDDLIVATGWLPHTTRAALTGLRKKGHAIDRDKIDGVACYMIKPVVAE